MHRVLITGINGFVGHHVAHLLHDLGISVLGIGNQPSLQRNLVGIVDEYISCDLTDAAQVNKINLSDITAIINLAGFAKVGESKGQGELYDKVNIGVHTVLYDECLRQKIYPRIIAVSTGAVYDPNQDLPITEQSASIPRGKTNEYVISKQKMEKAVGRYREKDLRVIIVRPFNHSGPGQLPGFLLPDLGEQILEATKNKLPLKVGNLKTKRDYTDVRDVARAYTELATCPSSNLKHDIYNICSGWSIAGSEILSYLTEAYGEKNLKTEVNPSKLRDYEVMDIYGSRDKITTDIGWKPEISIKQMVTDFVNWQKSQK